MSEALETASTQELIDELRSRHSVFFYCGRPLVTRDFAWQHSYGGEEDRVLGLIEMAKADFLKPVLDKNE